VKGWVTAVLCCSLCIPAVVGAETLANRIARSEHRQYISGTRPKRNEAFLRNENISDEEVREIQSAAQAVLPEAIVNISGVPNRRNQAEFRAWLDLYEALYAAFPSCKAN